MTAAFYFVHLFSWTKDVKRRETEYSCQWKKKSIISAKEVIFFLLLFVLFSRVSQNMDFRNFPGGQQTQSTRFWWWFRLQSRFIFICCKKRWRSVPWECYFFLLSILVERIFLWNHCVMTSNFLKAPKLSVLAFADIWRPALVRAPRLRDEIARCLQAVLFGKL